MMCDLSIKLQPINAQTAVYAADFFPSQSSAHEHTPLKLLMESFGSCVCASLFDLLRHRQHKMVESITAEVEGTLRSTHPKALAHIVLRMAIKATGVTEYDVLDGLRALEDHLSPVWSMIKGNTAVSTVITIDG